MSRDLASFLRILAAFIYTAGSSGLKNRNFGLRRSLAALAAIGCSLGAKSVWGEKLWETLVERASEFTGHPLAALIRTDFQAAVQNAIPAALEQLVCYLA